MRLPSPWRELLGGLVLLLATLAVSRWFPAGFAPTYAQPSQPVMQAPAGGAAVNASSQPRAKGAREGGQNLQLPIDTGRRADRAGFI